MILLMVVIGDIVKAVFGDIGEGNISKGDIW